MAKEQNPLLQKLKEQAAINFLGSGLNSESLEKRIKQEISKIQGGRDSEIESFYNRYPYSERGDIGGFEEGDLLRYQHKLNNYHKDLGLLASLCEIINRVSKFSSFYSESFKIFLKDYKPVSRQDKNCNEELLAWVGEFVRKNKP